MLCRVLENEGPPLKVINYSFALVKEFKYLGVTITVLKTTEKIQNLNMNEQQMIDVNGTQIHLLAYL